MIYRDHDWGLYKLYKVHITKPNNSERSSVFVFPFRILQFLFCCVRLILHYRIALIIGLFIVSSPYLLTLAVAAHVTTNDECEVSVTYMGTDPPVHCK